MRQHAGFSLLELSIVLVIIGLLSGGVIVGQELVKSAQLRSVMTEYFQYITSVNAFKSKYQSLPGDMRNATAYWGAAHATPATCVTTVGTGTQTCDGNGNGEISSFGNAQMHEVFHFWKHLSNAGLVNGFFTGVSGSASVKDALIEVNVPTSKFNGAGWSVENANGSSAEASPVFFNHKKGNYFWFGNQFTSFETIGSALTPQEAYDIDGKIDDSRAGTGNVMSRRSWTSCTINAAVSATAEYNLQNNAIACQLFIWMHP